VSRVLDSRCVLAIQDLNISTRFYIEVLGFQLDPVDAKGWSFLSMDSFSLCWVSVRMRSPPPRQETIRGPST
jgi:catechol-2,3-dioxygenase